MPTPSVPHGPRDELADIIDQAEVYLNWLQDEGIARVETGRPARGTKSAAVKPAAKPVVKPAAQPPSVKPAAGNVPAELQKIATVVAACTKCPLHSTRIQTVPGQGDPQPELMFVGEAPGADEDEQGLAFVGRAGQLLTKMIDAMGYRREEVFIGNILKCRPPNNRPPLPDEMETCLPYLKEQIRLLQPKVIVALGATSVRGLVGLDGISRLRGKWLVFEGIHLMPTYHPAYLLRNPISKKEVWVDLQEVLRFLGRTPPPTGARAAPAATMQE